MTSTIAFSPSFSQPFPSPTSTNNGDENSGSQLMQRGASYFFGFLITFVVLLLVFLCCGIGSRRRYIARRALVTAGSERDQCKVPLVEPTLWEPRLEKGGLDWSDMAPLSASVVRKPKSTEGPPLPPPPPSTIPITASLLSPTNLMRPFMHKPSQSFDIPLAAPEEPPPEALQVAVMIAMPSSAIPHPEQNDFDETSQFEIGVTRIRWDTEVES